jgi:hypothetical protein
VLKNVFTLPIKQVFPKGNIVGGITDLSIGVSKDIMVSVGGDKNIRVFEYNGSSHSQDQGGAGASGMMGSYNQLSSFRSKDVVNCIALHPMGL